MPGGTCLTKCLSQLSCTPACTPRRAWVLGSGATGCEEAQAIAVAAGLRSICKINLKMQFQALGANTALLDKIADSTVAESCEGWLFFLGIVLTKTAAARAASRSVVTKYTTTDEPAEEDRGDNPRYLTC